MSSSYSSLSGSKLSNSFNKNYLTFLTYSSSSLLPLLSIDKFSWAKHTISSCDILGSWLPYFWAFLSFISFSILSQTILNFFLRSGLPLVLTHLSILVALEANKNLALWKSVSTTYSCIRSSYSSSLSLLSSIYSFMYHAELKSSSSAILW